MASLYLQAAVLTLRSITGTPTFTSTPPPHYGGSLFTLLWLCLNPVVGVPGTNATWPPGAQASLLLSMHWYLGPQNPCPMALSLLPGIYETISGSNSSEDGPHHTHDHFYI